MLQRLLTLTCLRLFPAALCVAATGVQAQPADVPPGSLESSARAATGAWVLLHSDEFDWRSRGDRVSVARALAQRVALLKDRVPSQGLDEQARLERREARLASPDGARDPLQARSRLYLSTSYQHRALLRLLEDILEPLRCIQEPGPVRAEMACWSAAAAALLQEDQLALAISTLRRARRLPRQWETAMINRDPEVWYGQFGRGILAYVLTPYLSAAPAPEERSSAS
ncbi:MAG: hypothetical protein AAGI15_07425 [Pseudomonadota bacterium]